MFKIEVKEAFSKGTGRFILGPCENTDGFAGRLFDADGKSYIAALPFPFSKRLDPDCQNIILRIYDDIDVSMLQGKTLTG